MPALVALMGFSLVRRRTGARTPPTCVNSEEVPGGARVACGDAISDRLAWLKGRYDPAAVFCRNQFVRLAAEAASAGRLGAARLVCRGR